MIRHALLAGAVMIASPALAQTTTNTTSAPSSAAPTSAPATSAAPAAPVAAPVAQQAAPTTAQPSAQGSAATPSTAQPAATGATQVAQVVNTEFPTYDANKDGTLSSTEFDAWMVALKKVSDPTVSATNPETVKWNQAAFAQADTDKNKSISKAELTTFLSAAAG